MTLILQSMGDPPFVCGFVMYPDYLCVGYKDRFSILANTEGYLRRCTVFPRDAVILAFGSNDGSMATILKEEVSL